MTPSERSWLERTVADWGDRVAQMRRIACTRQSILNRADGLAEVVTGLQARLDAAPAPIDAPAPADGAPLGRVHAPDLARTAVGDFGGHQAEVEQLARADPLWFLRSQWAAMVNSARVCRSSGDYETAESYERRAAAAMSGPAPADRARAVAPRPRWPELPMIPPPVALPFVAGPQMSLEL